jgi:hypothetical protein
VWSYFQQGRELFSLQVRNISCYPTIIHKALSEIALSTIAAFCVAVVSIPAITQIIMSASSSLSRQEAVVIAEI